VKLVIHLDGKSIRGNESQMIVLATKLSERGHEVVASCRQGGEVATALTLKGIRTCGVRPAGDIAPFHTFLFASWLRREHPDAILVTSWKKSFVAGIASRAAGVPRIALRVGGMHRPSRSIDKWKYRSTLSNHYHVVIANSTVVRDHLVVIAPGVPHDLIRVIPNGVDCARMKEARACALPGIPPASTILMSAGGLEKRKGFDLLIRAMQRLDASIHLVIAGDGPERSSLESLSASLGVTAQVHLVGHRNDVADLMLASDIFVLASRGEGMSVAMLEAISCGRPVISTRVGGVSEVLEPCEGRGAAGWTVPVDDLDALAAAIGEVVSHCRAHREVVEERVTEAAWRTANWFAVDRMVENYERALQPI
jgi:glycosyltransferase involved in cell wall biosynthesis